MKIILYNIFRILSFFKHLCANIMYKGEFCSKIGGMNMRKKKLAGIFMSFMMAAGVLAGCGGASSTSGEKDDETIKIGANLELSGGVASYGQSIEEGIEIGY